MSVEKSEKDSRVFEAFELENRIKCLVISDPEAEHSAAAVNVKVGSLYETRHGIAHFLEHMLFMGTKKYPGENEYSNFLTSHSGYSNAYTASENTNYFFKVGSDHFREALDIFAQFFIEPLFLSDSVERELKAVDSEYNKNLQDDNWRIYQILRNSLSAPFNHFGIGNKETLDVEGIRGLVIEFYEKYYSANLMSLVIYGKEPAESLRAWAVELFSAVVNKDIQMPHFGVPQFANRGKITRIVPVKDSRTLKLLWTLPEQAQLYQEKPHLYLSNLLGHEGKNSLLSYLKYFNLAEELTSSIDEDFSSYSYLYIDVKLTEKGLQQYEKVLEIVYGYIEYLNQHNPQEWIFNELKAVAYSEFTFKNKEDPFWYSQKLSARLQKYPSSKVLTGAELFEKFDENLIKDCIKCLDVQFLQVFLISKDLDQSRMLKEKWYGTSYLTEDLDGELLARLKSPNLDLTAKQLAHPPVNPYIPSSHLTVGLSESKTPSEILRNEKTRVFYKKSSKFDMDKVYGQVLISCNSVRFDVSVFSYILAELFVKFIKEKIREEAYQAEIAGLNFSIDVDKFGVRVQLNGFSQKFASFFQFIVESLASAQVEASDESLFNDLKSQFLLKFKNVDFSKPYEHVQRLVYETNLSGGYFTNKAKLKALETMEFADFVWFCPRWLKNVHFEWLVVGNITSEAVTSMVTSSIEGFEKRKQCTFMTTEEFSTIKSLKITKKTQTRLASHLPDASDTNSAVISQWQVGKMSFKAQGVLAMIDNFLDEPCFDVLRTKEQLGYIVWSYSHEIRGILNFVVCIQSSVKHPSFLFQRINEFIKGMAEELEKIDENRLEQIKVASIKTTFKKDLSLKDEFNRFKFEVDNSSYNFNRKNVVKKEIRQTQLREFKEMFLDVFVNRPRRLNLHALAFKMKEDEESAGYDGERVFHSVSEFWRENGTWPQVYIRQV
jgi:insulysin